MQIPVCTKTFLLKIGATNHPGKGLDPPPQTGNAQMNRDIFMMVLPQVVFTLMFILKLNNLKVSFLVLKFQLYMLSWKQHILRALSLASATYIGPQVLPQAPGPRGENCLCYCKVFKLLFTAVSAMHEMISLKSHLA